MLIVAISLKRARVTSWPLAWQKPFHRAGYDGRLLKFLFHSE